MGLSLIYLFISSPYVTRKLDPTFFHIAEMSLCNICDVSLNLVPFAQFQRHKETLVGVLLLTVTHFHWCFSRFLNCTNGTKSRRASHLYDMKKCDMKKKGNQVSSDTNLFQGLGTIMWNIFRKLVYIASMICEHFS